MWLETARGAHPTQVLAGRITTDECEDAMFLAAVLQLPPILPSLDVSRLLTSASEPRRCASCPRWQGWLVGEHPHFPVSITVMCSGERREAVPAPAEVEEGDLRSWTKATGQPEAVRPWYSSARTDQDERAARLGGR